MNLIAISIGAGLASALLFAAVGTGSPLAAGLTYLAPLPVLIVSMGWHQRGGLGAALLGTAAIAIVLRPTTGLAYALSSGPAWWIGYLALLGRPTSADEQGAGAPATEWYPLGRLLFWIAGTAAAITIVAAITLGGFDAAAYRAALGGLIEAFLRYQADIGRDAAIPPIAGVPAARVVRIIVLVIPLIAAASFTLLFVANTWFAGRVAAISGRLIRPWPFIPATRMPLAAAGLLACGAVLLLAPGFAEVVGAAVVGALGMAFAMQGLTLIHAATFVRPGPGGSRSLTLGLLYILTVTFAGTMLPLLALVGLLDSIAPLRRRFATPTTLPD